MSFGDRPTAPWHPVGRTNELILELRTKAASATAELASYKAQPFVPLADHQRIAEQLARAQAENDRQAGEILRLQDKSVARLAEERLAIMTRLSRILGKTAAGMDERGPLADLFCHVALHGEVSEEVAEMRERFQEWEAGR